MKGAEIILCKNVMRPLYATSGTTQSAIQQCVLLAENRKWM